MAWRRRRAQRGEFMAAEGDLTEVELGLDKFLWNREGVLGVSEGDYEICTLTASVKMKHSCFFDTHLNAVNN